ncbi:MAG: acetamidase/formamidase family protein [Fibrella sp.]|nr:acetamidase/formamidase family protein [Armatimonadota bacterium]
MAIHHVEPGRETLTGIFSCDDSPFLSVDPGDTVIYQTLDAGWHLNGDGARFEPRDLIRDNGHAMCGPIAIRGAEPGMTLGVHIGAIRTGTWGWTVAGAWAHPVNERLGLADADEYLLSWVLDPDTLTGRSQFGHTLALRPFLGVMGMPTNEPGMLPTSPPRRTGGNLDCKELVSGSVLYLPVEVSGGLFCIGDGHAAQGDGEVSVTAIECPMERVEITFSLHDDMPIRYPRANTPAGWLTLGLHEDLNEATYLALEEMLDLMQEQYGYGRQEALAIASLTVDLRITQIVNGVRGVHAILPHGAIKDTR